MESVALDAAGHRRSPATMPGYHQGRAPRNKGLRYPADPPTIEEIVAVMRAAGNKPDGTRLRALMVLLWRAGLRIGEALALAETDLDRSRGAVLVRHGKGGKRREVGMDRWAWQQLTRGLSSDRTFRSARCSASSTARPPGGIGSLPPLANSSGGPPRLQECADGSLPTSSAMRTRSRWRTKASRSLSSSASSGTRTSGSPRSICKGSTTPKSSTPFTHVRHRPSARPPV
jgi:integrase